MWSLAPGVQLPHPALCAPSEDSDQTANPCSLISLHYSLRTAKDPRLLYVDSEIWTHWVNTQADLSFCCAHRSFCWFWCAPAPMEFLRTNEEWNCPSTNTTGQRKTQLREAKWQAVLEISFTILSIMFHIYHNTDWLLRGVIDKFVSFFYRIIIYGWIYIIFCHYIQQPVLNRTKTLKCKVRQICDVTITLMTSHVGNVVVKMLEDRCGWCTLSGYKYYSTSAIIVKISDNICT